MNVNSFKDDGFGSFQSVFSGKGDGVGNGQVKIGQSNLNSISFDVFGGRQQCLGGSTNINMYANNINFNFGESAK